MARSCSLTLVAYLTIGPIDEPRRIMTPSRALSAAFCRCRSYMRVSKREYRCGLDEDAVGAHFAETAAALLKCDGRAPLFLAGTDPQSLGRAALRREAETTRSRRRHAVKRVDGSCALSRTFHEWKTGPCRGP